MQNPIRWDEDGYPDPHPPSDDPEMRVKDADRWFDDDEFNKASEEVDLFDTEVAVDDVEDLNGGTSDGTVLSLSNIKPSTKKKPTLRFDNVDNHARKVSFLI